MAKEFKAEINRSEYGDTRVFRLNVTLTRGFADEEGAVDALADLEAAVARIVEIDSGRSRWTFDDAMAGVVAGQGDDQG